MKRATQLTAESLAFTREVVERPYVVMNGSHPQDIETHKTPRFIVEFRNTGRTPAAVSVSVTLQDRTTEIPEGDLPATELTKTQDLTISGGSASRGGGRRSRLARPERQTENKDAGAAFFRAGGDGAKARSSELAPAVRDRSG
jgi:hypothetical protein